MNKSDHPSDQVEAKRLDLQIKQIELSHKRAEDLRKETRRRQFTLMIVCLLAVSYTYPVSDLSNNPSIEIKAIDLSIHLKDAMAVFPTIISCCYLICLSSAINYTLAVDENWESLRQFWEPASEKRSGRTELWHFFVLRNIFVPSLFAKLPVGAGSKNPAYLYYRGFTSVTTFTGVVFSATPFASAIFVTVHSYKLIQNRLILFWDLVCIAIMVVTVLTSIIGTYRGRKEFFKS